ncbi:50S ribosomal protein L6 [Candidatus Bathyarchaeota archaeon]|nr:MAG: 50S ribosomal protein L6 [Candidatus Bathyarchaeota archaeon]
MVRTIVEERSVTIPEGVEAKLEGKILTVKGPLGELKRDFSFAPVYIGLEDKKIVVRSFLARKTEKAIVGTITSHIKNMVKGVTKGFTYKLKKVYSHFPINVKVSGDKVLIENFIGERSPRIAKIVGNVKINVKGDDIEVQGLNLEEVSQTAANIQQATKIKKKDPRVFLDGIYIYEKTEGLSS